MILKLLSRNGWKMLSCAVFSSSMLYATLQSHAQIISTNSQGTHDGFFYSFWSDNSQGSASMTLGAAGNYSTISNNVGNFIAGKGWAKGKADRVICFSGNFSAGNNGFLSLYGWTKNHLIEYYVCENHGVWIPPGTATAAKGTYISDGGTYTIYEITRTNHLTMIGMADYKLYWSVRTQKRSSGTITFANHVAAWKKAGMELGDTWEYQIMATEEYMSSGSSNISVSDCEEVITEVNEHFMEQASVFPNPVTDDLYLTGFANDFEYVVSDYSGRAVLKGQNATKVDLKALEAGIYFIKVKQEQGSKTIKITKL